jgi:CBS domain containing-hemolysin-like protein
VSEEDIVIMLDAGADEGTLKQDDIEYIKNVFKLEDTNAADVMTRRAALVAVPRDIEEDSLLELIEKEGYSRLPVYDEDLDHIVGILHVRNYLLSRGREGFTIEDALIPAEFVPETVRLDQLFKDMQKERTHMVVVINEYGMTLGVVTMEDIIEELVGEIFDEADEAVEESRIVKTEEENTYRAGTDVTVDEFFEFFELEKDEQIESTTLNGWISERCGCIPEVGFSFTYENLTITVTEAEELRALAVKIVVAERSEDAENEEENDEE